MPDLPPSLRAAAEAAALALEAAGDLTAVRTLRYQLAAGDTDPATLARTATELLDARLSTPAGRTTAALPAPDDLRQRASRVLTAVNTRLARVFEARLAEIRLSAEQQLMVGVGSAEEALASFHADVARLAHDLETSLWAEIGWLATGVAAEIDRYGLARLASDLPAPLRRIPVTLSLMESTGPAITAGDAVTGIAQAAKQIHGLTSGHALALDPTGTLVPVAVALTVLSAKKRVDDARRANRGIALRHVADACDNARSGLLDPVFRAATQAQIFLVDRALTDLSAARTSLAPAPGTDPVRESLLQARAQVGQAAHR